MKLLICAASAANIIAAIVVLWPNSPTFEQRWAPVSQIDPGWKGDRLDRKPPPAITIDPLPFHWHAYA